MKKIFCCSLTALLVLFARAQDPYAYVDPFIGTTRSASVTKWGNEGGLYPGAVAPWGFVQLSPETRSGDGSGYDYADSSVFYFSCFAHHSGFPGGSAGGIDVMPLAAAAETFQVGVDHRPFRHSQEHAEPGFYSLQFADDGTRVEMTASERTGLFRFHFPAGVRPRIFIGRMGKISVRADGSFEGERGVYTVMRFSERVSEQTEVKDGLIVAFDSLESKGRQAGKARQSASGHSRETGGADRTILLRLSVSTVSAESAAGNIRAEAEVSGNGTDFGRVRAATARKWADLLQVVAISDDNKKHKKVFYTALYHSLLLPWIVSDSKGQYRGGDRRIHTVEGRNEYGEFSPWDTFRSLHPLLCLLFPDRQKDMILSMVDIYKERGSLPTETMTGNHSIPILVDSWFKGIRGGDSLLLYTAMRKGVADTPYSKSDRAVFLGEGYIPADRSESVTRTVEYAYDDWALSRFAAAVMHREDDAKILSERGHSYRNLFDPSELFFLPRKSGRRLFTKEPGTVGYKEGDKWVYSYFMPQDNRDLINLMGGDEAFTARLDEALSKGQILFDNETVFHLPYLFNEAGRPDKTQQWIRSIMEERYTARPGGLPGNDDLGSMSAWYVLSSMGFYPNCPGRPYYTIGSPVFASCRLKLRGGKTFSIRKMQPAGKISPFVKSLDFNGRAYHSLRIDHARILEGGELLFHMDSQPDNGWVDKNGGKGFPDEVQREAEITVSGMKGSKDQPEPDELFAVSFSLNNKGATGTKIVRLLVNGVEYSRKNILVNAGATIRDSITTRLYPIGRTVLTIEGLRELVVTVVPPATEKPLAKQLEIGSVMLQSLVRTGAAQEIGFTAKNTGGYRHVFSVPVLINDSAARTDTVGLEPGQTKNISVLLNGLTNPGWKTVRIGNAQALFKVYDQDTASALLNLSTRLQAGSPVVSDRSGFSNYGEIAGPDSCYRFAGGTGVSDSRRLAFGDCYIEVPSDLSLDRLGETITMMAWVRQESRGHGYVDLFSKGDNHVLQLAGGHNLTFFAGGWGRGDCTVDLPADWLGRWHHIAGVCTGSMLYVYIDGELKGSAHVDGTINLSVPSRWVVGRNEEFPGERIFRGQMDGIKVFAEPLSAEDVKRMMGEKPAD